MNSNHLDEIAAQEEARLAQARVLRGQAEDAAMTDLELSRRLTAEAEALEDEAATLAGAYGA